MDKTKIRFITLIIGAVLCSMVSAFAAAALFEWENMTCRRFSQDMAVYNGEIWSVSTGGLVRVDPEDESITVYTNEDGLQTNRLYCLHVDDRNRLWVGGEGRLVNFSDPNNPDGYLFTDRDDEFIPIRDIASVPGSDTLWLANDRGLTIFLPGQSVGDGLILDTYNRFGDIDRDTPARHVAVDRDSIWVGTTGGMAVGSRYDIRQLKAPTGWTSYKLTAMTGLASDSIMGLTFIDDSLYVSGVNGVFSFDTESGLFDDLGLSDITIIYNSGRSGDSLFLYTSRGLFIYYNQTLLQQSSLNMPIPNVTCGVVDPTGTVWLGSLVDGLFRMHEGALEELSTGGLPGSECRQIVYTQGKTWGAFWSAGLAYEQNDQWVRVDGVTGSVVSLGVGPMGELWVGTWGNGVYRIDGDSTAHYNVDNSALSGLSESPDFVVVADIQSSGDAVWLANLRGRNGELVAVNPYDTDEWTRYILTGGSSAEWVETIAIGQETIYIGSAASGIFARLYNGSPFFSGDDFTWRFSTDNSNIGSDIIKYLYIDKYDSLWVGTSFGLSFQSLGEVFFANEILPEDFGPEVTAVSTDPQGSVYIGSSRGLAVRDIATGDYTYLHNRNSGLADDIIYDIYYDEPEHLFWISTANGISKLNLPAQSSDDIDEVLAYPNPFVIRNGDETVRFTFAGRAEVRIFTAAGELVREIPVTGLWDGKNSFGEYVASGLYFFTLRGMDGEVGQGKIFLIRE